MPTTLVEAQSPRLRPSAVRLQKGLGHSAKLLLAFEARSPFGANLVKEYG
jgi:hypothetical protein